MAPRTLLVCIIAVMGAIAAPAGAASEERFVPPVVLLTTALDYDPVRYEAAYMIAEAWGELGLVVEVEPLAFPDLIGRVHDRQDFDAAILGWSGRVDRLDPQFFLGLLDSRQVGLRGNNVTGYDNVIYDAVFQAQSRALETADRIPLVHAAQAIAARDVPLAVIAHRDTVAAYAIGMFDNLVVVPSDGLYSEWNMMGARPLTDRTRLRIGGHQRPDNFNPLVSTTGWGWRWMRLYYDFLVRLTPEAEARLWAAEKIEIAGSSAIEVTLREGMTFHDGMPVTAHDVAFSFTHLLASGFSYYDAYLDALDAVEVVDDLTVRFILRYPSASFVTTALSQVAILPRHLWENIEEPELLDAGMTPVVGSGPFRFTGYDADSRMSLDRFDAHFMADDIAISGVDFLYYPDNTAVFSALLSREVDITAGTLDPWHIPAVERAPDIGILAAPDIGFNHVYYNLRRKPFDNVAFRRALTHAIDRDRIVDALLSGRALARASIIAPVNAFWHNPDIEHLEYDMHKAFAELESAGFEWDDTGRLLMPETGPAN